MPAGFNFYLSLNQQSNVTFPSFYTFIFLLLRRALQEKAFLSFTCFTYNVRPFKNDGRIGKEALGPQITKNAILFGANDSDSMKHDLIGDLLKSQNISCP